MKKKMTKLLKKIKKMTKLLKKWKKQWHKKKWKNDALDSLSFIQNKNLSSRKIRSQIFILGSLPHSPPFSCFLDMFPYSFSNTGVHLPLVITGFLNLCDFKDVLVRDSDSIRGTYMHLSV